VAFGARFSELDLPDPEFIPGRRQASELKFAPLAFSPIFRGVDMFLRHTTDDENVSCEL